MIYCWKINVSLPKPPLSSLPRLCIPSPFCLLPRMYLLDVHTREQSIFIGATFLYVGRAS